MLKINMHVKLFLVLLLVMVLVCSIGLSSSAATLPDQVSLSWTTAVDSTQTISWRMPDYCTSAKVQYVEGIASDFLQAGEVVAVSQPLYTGYLRFQATISQLKPHTTYSYRVGCDGCWSEVAQFVTGQADGSFACVFLGDPQELPADLAKNQPAGGYDDWGVLLDNAMQDEANPNFVLLGGDLVNDGTSASEWADFFAAGKDVFESYPMMPVKGNHEDTLLFNSYFAMPQNGPQGALEDYYSFDYGDAHFVMLNSNNLGYVDWLEQDLASTDKKWKMVMFHQPPYPAIASNKDLIKAEALNNSWVPVLEKYGVDVVLNGHHHVYARSYPMKNGKVSTADGITYVIGVSGGKKYSADEHDYFAKLVENTSCYTIVEVQKNSLLLTTKDANGVVIDSYNIEKMGSGGEEVQKSAYFKDMDNHWGIDEVDKMAAAGYVKGNDEACFLPNKLITRAEVAAILVRMLAFTEKCDSLPSDVPDDAWYTDAISIALNSGILTGYTDGTVKPTAFISRAELAIMLQRASDLFDKPIVGDKKVVFGDEAKIPVWAKDAVLWAAQVGIIQGDSTSCVNSTAQCSRAEGAAMLCRLADIQGLLK